MNNIILVTGVPIPKLNKGRPSKPLNPTLRDMPAGASFVVTGEAAAKAILADVARARKARTDVLFKTRNLAGQLNPVTFEAYPAHTVGVWCVQAPAPTPAPIAAPVGHATVEDYIDSLELPPVIGQTSEEAR